ncbi:abortive infection protein [Arthrobacter sp. SW1]|uniref:CPBP family intramembrane glutamic endopeptidase n=1 Tax=Arthrobacter sp. SW1 TaxID=1920889 RepID=UPI000877D3B8|nr:CPBP family intramembrane glutamic endopeptidase [Arthrobacter sp. SW1]OFI37254.1 abortive infection protein [Arthrobacter sp. SW1]
MGTIPPPGRLYRFTGLDAVAAGLYLGLMFFAAFAGQLIAPLLSEIMPTQAAASYAVNLVFYSSIGIFALVAAWSVLARDTRILATRPWFTLAMVPAAVVVMLVFTAIVVAATGQARPSENQLSLQSLIQGVPAWLVVPLLVVIGPFVEEYIFRHLLIGKLSGRLNIWLCCALSIVLFAGIHVFSNEGLSVSAMVPYLAMGSVLVAVYVWTGMNLAFSFLVHAGKNLLAVLLIYAIPPEFFGA